MDEDDALVGGSDEEDRRESEEEEEEGDEEEPDGMVDEGEEADGAGADAVDDLSMHLEAAKLSELTMEYNRQHSHPPEHAVVRDHKRPHVVSTPEKLGEMKASDTNAKKWPLANSIDPATIVVLQGRIKEDDETLHFVWYMRVVVEGREQDSDDIRALLHIPRGTVKDMLTVMAKDEQLCESSLITQYMPTNYNDQRILPKLNGWEPLSKPPKTLAIKPKDAGKGGKTKSDDSARDPPASAPPEEKKKAAKVAQAPPAPKVPHPKTAAAKATAKSKAPTSKAEGKKPAQPSVTASLKAAKPANPFEKAKPPAPKAPAAAPSPPTVPEDDTPLERMPTYDPSDPTEDEPTAPAPAPAALAGASACPGVVSRAMNIDKKLTAVTHEFTFDTFDRKYIEFSPPAGAVRAEAKVVYHFI